MAPFVGKKNIEKAIINLLEENVDDGTRESQRKTNRAWIQFYKNKLKQYANKKKRINGR